MPQAGTATWALLWSLAQVLARAIYSSHDASWCNVGQQDRCDGNLHFLDLVPSYSTDSTDFLFTGNDALGYGFCDRWKPSYVIAFTDWDLDHNLDVVAVDKDGHGLFFERLADGSLSSYPFPLGGLAVNAPDIGSYSGLGDTTLHAVDWDGDGRTDLVVSQQNDTHHWSRLFKRTGNLTLEEQAGAMGLLDTIKCEGYFYCRAEFLDWDGDEDIDVVYWNGQQIRFFERSTGDRLIEHKDARNPLKGLSINVDSSNSFRITDWDGDGDKDFFLFGFGAQYTRGSDASQCTIHFVEQLADGSFVLHNDGGPLADMHLHSSCGQTPWKLEFVDWNLDGLVDMWFGPELYMRKQDESYYLQEGRSDPFSQLRFGIGSEPYFVDWDSDGDVDVIVIQKSYYDSNASLALLDHAGDGTFHRRPLELEVLDKVRLGLGDWDNDGDVDLVYTEFSSGRIIFLERVGDALVERTGIENPFAGINVTVGPNTSKEMRDCFLYGGYDWQVLYQAMDCLNQPIEPILADWDGDGDLDLLLTPPSGRYFERMPNGSLEERFGSQNPWPEEPGQGDLLTTDSEADKMRGFRWTVADADGDGDMDILYVLANRNTGHAFVRTGVCLRLTPERVQCQPSRAHRSGGQSYRFADLDSDGDLDMLSMGDTSEWAEVKLEYWRRSLCRPSQPCSGNGVCAPLSSRCSCGEGYDNIDCSACARDFYTAHPQDGVIRVCVRCATDQFSSPKAEVCSGRGWCFDDLAARSHAGPLTEATVTGNGSCYCSNKHFNGTDASGRTHCGDGICPDGSIEALNANLRNIGVLEVGSPVRTCNKCLPGSASTGGQECTPCSPGSFTADYSSEACLPCPEGTYVAESGALGCTLCPLGRWAGNGSVSCRRCDAGWVPAANGSTCDKCPAGKAVLDKEAFTCAVCPAGTFSWGGSVVCKSCPAGSFSKNDSATCEACPEGHKSDPTATVCVPCQAGSWAAAGSPVCHPCSADSVSEAQSSQCFPCTSTFYNRVPGSARHVCHPDPNSLVGTAAMLVCLFLAGLSLLQTFVHSVPIADVSVDQGALILTTWGPHRVLEWKWAAPTVYLVGTSVPWLDNPGKAGLYRVKARDATQLVLLHPEGQVGPWGTSMGRLFIAPTCAWRCVGYLRVPCTVWFSLFLAGAFTSTLAVPLYSAAGEALFASFSVAIWWLRQRRQINKTPLARQRTKFLKRLRRNNPRPVRTQRGPQRAISAGQLCEFHEHFQGFIKERSTYYICPNLVRPLTTEDHCSYAELAGPGQVRWFVSHYWGTGFRHFVFTVRNHARAFCGDELWHSQRYWICTFSNNQWDIGAELGDGQWQQSSFYLALRDNNCGGTAMVLDEEAMPLTRAWCLFEVVQTLLLSQQSNSFTGLALCSESGVLNHGSAGTDVCIAVAGRLATMDLRNAQASDEGDLQRIFALVNSMPGGFDAVNGFVRSSIRDALLAVRGRFERDFVQLSGKLASANCQPSPVDAKLVSLTSVAGDSADLPTQDRVPGPRLLGALQNMQAQAKGDEECDEWDVELGRGCKVCV